MKKTAEALRFKTIFYADRHTGYIIFIDNSSCGVHWTKFKKLGYHTKRNFITMD